MSLEMPLLTMNNILNPRLHAIYLAEIYKHLFKSIQCTVHTQPFIQIIQVIFAIAEKVL